MATKLLGSTGTASGADIFSSDLTWDPKLAKNLQPDNVMNQIVDEMESWLHLENFNFPILQKYRADAICDVSSVTNLLFTVTQFLEQVEDSENQLVLKLLSASLQSEQTRLKYVWWRLGNCNKGVLDFAEKLLGRRLHEVLVKYRSSRTALRNFVNEQLSGIKTWAGAYSNGQAAFVLQDARKQLRYVHQDFQAWQAAVSVTVIRKCWDKYSNRQMSFHEIKRELEGMAMKIKQPSSSPSIDPSEMPKKQDCSRECITNTQFLHFSRGQSLQCPEIRRSVVPVRTESQRISAASETDSGLSASPPSQMSSWLESDLSSYTSSSEVPLAQFTENSMCNYRVPPRRMGSPISPVLLQAACTWVEDSSISENDTEDISEVFFNSVRINRNQPSWAAMVDETTNTLISNSSLVDEVGEIGFQDFPAVITGEGNPHFWQNILNLASITDRTD